MNCKNCGALRWHPNKGFYCTVPNCNPDTTVNDVREIYKKAGLILEDKKIKKGEIK